MYKNNLRLNDDLFRETLYTHQPTSAAEPNAAIYLIVNGAYAADSILLDDVSLRQADQPVPARIINMLSNEVVATQATGWTDTLALNEQKIYRIAGPLATESTAGEKWGMYR